MCADYILARVLSVFSVSVVRVCVLCVCFFHLVWTDRASRLLLTDEKKSAAMCVWREGH